jgi:transposase-like protein
MGRPSMYPPELRERAVRMVQESGRPIRRVAADLGIHHEAVRERDRARRRRRRVGQNQWDGKRVATGWQQGGNTPPCTTCKELGGETGEIGFSWALSTTNRNQPQTPRRPRMKGSAVRVRSSASSTSRVTQAGCYGPRFG